METGNDNFQVLAARTAQLQGRTQDSLPQSRHGRAGVAGQARAAGWRTGRIPFPALVVLLIVLGAAGLGAASIGGWGSVAVLVILIGVVLALITSWAVTD